MAVIQISVTDLKRWLNDAARSKPLLLDVREAWEFERCALPNSRHIPMTEMPARVGELNAQADTVVICHHGGRSLAVANYLDQAGFQHVHNLSGGVDAWSRLVDTSMPRY